MRNAITDFPALVVRSSIAYYTEDHLCGSLHTVGMPIHLQRRLITEAFGAKPYGVTHLSYAYTRYLVAWRPNKKGRRVWMLVVASGPTVKDGQPLPDRLAYYFFRTGEESRRLQMLLDWDHASHAKAKRLGVILPAICWRKELPQWFIWHATAPVCYVGAHIITTVKYLGDYVCTPMGWGHITLVAFREKVLNAPTEEAITKAREHAIDWRKES